jgi:hypothetical protein
MEISTKNVLIMFYFKFQSIHDYHKSLLVSLFLPGTNYTTNFSEYKEFSTILVLIFRIQCVSSTILVLQNPCLHHSPNQSLNHSHI